MKSCEEVVYRSSWCDVNSPPLSDWSMDGGQTCARSGRSSSPMAGARSGRLMELLVVPGGMEQLPAKSSLYCIAGCVTITAGWVTIMRTKGQGGHGRRQVDKGVEIGRGVGKEWFLGVLVK